MKRKLNRVGILKFLKYLKSNFKMIFCKFIEITKHTNVITQTLLIFKKY